MGRITDRFSRGRDGGFGPVRFIPREIFGIYVILDDSKRPCIFSSLHQLKTCARISDFRVRERKKEPERARLRKTEIQRKPERDSYTE